MWLAETEGVKFWFSVLTDLKNRELQDIQIACVDGLKRLPGSDRSCVPETKAQLCIVHMVRNLLKYVSWKNYKAVTVGAGLKDVYLSPSEAAARAVLERFAERRDEQYPQISKSWRTRWPNLVVPARDLHY